MVFRRPEGGRRGSVRFAASGGSNCRAPQARDFPEADFERPYGGRS
jgi:hypothetical protein